MFAVLRRIMQKQQAFLPAPAISLSLMALLIVVVVTGNLTGGFGLQVLGSSAQGGKRYYDIIAAVIGYFALVSQPIPPARAKFFMALFLLPASIAAFARFTMMLLAVGAPPELVVAAQRASIDEVAHARSSGPNCSGYSRWARR